jgi:hypothetical protein
MEEGSSFLDTVFLIAGLVMILLTIFSVSRRRSGSRRPVEGQRMATFGILIWLALVGVALYLIFS